MNITLTKRNAARVFILMIFLIAPLYVNDGFNNILRAKTYIVWLSIVIGIALALLLCGKWIIDRIKDKNFINELLASIASFAKDICTIDIFVAVFGIVVLVSSALSEHPEEALFGSMAWNVGGLLLFALCALYFIYSWFAESDFVGFIGMMIGGIIAMILAVLNDLWIDPLHILTEDENWRDHFTSTIGNIDQFSGYLSIIIPIMVMMFVVSENGFKRTAAAVVLFFSYLNIFLTHADSVYIGVGIGYLFIIGFCLKSPNRYLGLLINGILFGISGFAAKVIILYRPEIRLDDISPILIAHNMHLLIGGICFMLLLLHMFLELHLSKEVIGSILRIIFIIYVVVVIIAVVAVIVFSAFHFDFNFLNRRGLLWYISVYSFSDADTLQQLIGIGPGCVDTISENFYFEIEEAYEGFYFLENLHNDVLEYLVTTGVIGAGSYLGIYIYIIIDFIKVVFGKVVASTNKCYAMIGLIGYIAQSILNGPHPLSTAIFFTLLIIYRAETRLQKRLWAISITASGL